MVRKMISSRRRKARERGAVPMREARHQEGRCSTEEGGRWPE
jgi:hypothetical protein